MKWIDPRFAGSTIVNGAPVRLPARKVEPVEFAVHRAPPTLKGRREGKQRGFSHVPIFALIPVRTGKLYDYTGKR